jgi:predicted nucleic acid-binding protein
LKRKFVVDAGPLALFFAGHKEVRKYFEMMYSGSAELYVNEVNLAEFFYNYILKFGKEVALTRYRQVRSSPIRVVSPDDKLTERAAMLKASHKGLSLADAYLIATAEEVSGEIVTTDSLVKEVSGVKTVLIEF